MEYKGVVPGTTLPKNPKVTVSGLSGDAYVFVVVNNKLTDLDSTNTTQDGIVAEISNEWTQLPNKNNVFYKAVTADQAGFITKTTSEGEVTEPKSLPINVLKDNQVSTTNFTATEANKDLGSLEFKTYLTQQSGFTSASNAWETAFAGVAEGTGAQLAGALTE